jgi:hypothetical protein
MQRSGVSQFETSLGKDGMLGTTQDLMGNLFEGIFWDEGLVPYLESNTFLNI